MKGQILGPYYDAVPYARVETRAVPPGDMSFFRKEDLGFAPCTLEEYVDGSEPCAYAFGEGWKVEDDEEQEDLAAFLARHARQLFDERCCRVLVRTRPAPRINGESADPALRARQAALMHERLTEALDACDAEPCERALRTGERQQLIIVPKNVEGPTTSEPFQLAGKFIDAVLSLFEHWTLTGEERSVDMLMGFETTVAIESQPQGYVRRCPPCVVGLGIEWRF